MKPLALSTLAALTAAGLLAYAVGPVTLVSPPASLLLGIGATFALLGTVLRVWRPDGYVARVGDSLQAAGVITAMLLAGCLVPVMVTPWTGPWADALLAAPEQAIDLTQPEVYRWAAEAGALPTLEMVYESVKPQLLAACLWWALMGDARALWRAAAIFGVCLCVGIPLYLMMPALGPDVYYETGIRQAHVGPLLAIRAGGYELTGLIGVIASPSYHFVFSILLVQLWRRTPFALASLLVNTVPMWLATWTVGAHWLADLAVGAVLVVGAAYVVDSTTRETT